MKKFVIVSLFLILPFTASAEVDKRAGVEFQSPLVQQIVQLLYERIHDLSAQVEKVKSLNTNDRIKELEAEVRDLKLTNQSLRNTVVYEQSKPVPQCPLGVVKPQAEKENKIASLKQQILEISLKTIELQKELNQIRSIYYVKYAVTNKSVEGDAEIKRLMEKMASLELDKQGLQTQLNFLQ